MRTLLMVAYTLAVLPVVAVGFVAGLVYYPLLNGYLQGLNASRWLANRV